MLARISDACIMKKKIMDDNLEKIKSVLKSDFESVVYETKMSEGYQACKSGAEFWQNPYSDGDGSRRYFKEWFAGWCRAKKEQANNGEV